MFDTLKTQLAALLAKLEAATGTSNATELIDEAQSVTNQAFDLMKKFAGGVTFAGPGCESKKAECRSLCDRITACCRACHAGPNVATAAVGSINLGAILQAIQTVLQLVIPLLS